MQKTIIYIGADISKTYIHLHAQEGKVPTQIENCAEGYKKLIKSLEKSALAVQVICEATGAYYREFIEALEEASIAYSVINPRYMRHFAQALGVLAKTDKIDAQIIAEYGERMKPPADPPTNPHHNELEALTTRRNQLIGMRSAETLRLEQTKNQSARQSIKTLIKAIEKQIAGIEEEMENVVRSSAELKEKVDLLMQVEGVGQCTAFSLLGAMPELGTLSKNQVAALAGLAPFNHDSGKTQKSRSIRGGRCAIRKALYMAALSASRFNPILRDFYQRLLAKGKKPKVALTAVMRKLLIYLNSLLKKTRLNYLLCSP